MEPTGGVEFGAPVYAGEAAPATATPRQRASVKPAVPPAGVAPSLSPAPPPESAPTMLAGPQNADQFGQELHQRTEQYIQQLNELHKGDTPEPKFAQADPLKGFASLGGLIGVFGSLLSKQPLVSALNASASAMEALKKGNVEEYAAKVKEWSMHRDYVMQVEGNISKQYNAIFADKKLNYQEQAAERRALLAQTNANAHLALAGGAHTLAIDKYNRQLENDALTRGDKSRAEAIHLVTAAYPHMSQEGAVRAATEMAQALASGTFDAGMAVNILNGKPAKPQSGAGSALLSEFATAANTMKPGSPPLELVGQKYTYKDIQEIKKATDPTMLKTPLRNGWDAIHKGTLAPQPRPTALPVAKQDTGTNYTIGQQVTVGGKKYKVVGSPGPDPDLEEVK